MARIGSLTLITLVGCGQNPDVYTIPKERPPERQASNTGSSSAADPGDAMPGIGFQLPEGWTENAGGSMRAASFTVRGPEETEADVAVIPLPQLSGREVDFVNLWREQMELPPITRDQLADETQTVPVADGLGQLFDLASEKPLIDDRHKARILVVMQSRDNLTWFFKLTGPETLVEEQRQPFLDFLKSVNYTEAPASAPRTTPAGGTMAQAGTAPSTDHTHDDLPQWSPPDAWKSKEPGRMLRASFDIDAGESGVAEMTVSAFPGDVGGVLANVNRWRRQLGLEPVSDEQLASLIQPLDLQSGQALLVNLSNDTTAMASAILPHGGSTWFFKLMGDKLAVEQEADRFVEFLNSIRFH